MENWKLQPREMMKMTLLEFEVEEELEEKKPELTFDHLRELVQ